MKIFKNSVFILCFFFIKIHTIISMPSDIAISSINKLPDDVLEIVCSYLPEEDLLSVRFVNRDFSTKCLHIPYISALRILNSFIHTAFNQFGVSIEEFMTLMIHDIRINDWRPSNEYQYHFNIRLCPYNKKTKDLFKYLHTKIDSKESFFLFECNLIQCLFKIDCFLLKQYENIGRFGDEGIDYHDKYITFGEECIKFYDQFTNLKIKKTRLLFQVYFNTFHRCAYRFLSQFQELTSLSPFITLKYNNWLGSREIYQKKMEFKYCSATICKK